ncbi:MAG: acetyl-CoA C-acyltransferase, partial [Bdellovibrionales bacterium]|nr:acetyl-CoA C-acyltransferase [Bdellovibrionales bacterium]
IFLKLARTRTIGEKLALLTQMKPKYIFPLPPSPKEPSTGLTMGQHMEITAKELGIKRLVQDEIALKSHKMAAKAQADGYMAEEIVGIGGVETDNLVRSDTSLEKLSSLKPVFDRSEAGTLTAGNSSALTDGASAVCLMSETEAKKRGLEILSFLEGVQFAAISPSDGLLMAPAVALPKLLSRYGLKVADIDLFEIHEAFGAQVAANFQAWEKGWQRGGENIAPIGVLPQDKTNINGGSIAIGHPFAATGGRLVTSLALSLKRKGLKRGIISVCAAGAMAAAVLLTRE